MGRPYAREVTCFPDTFEWSLAFDLTTLENAVRRASRFPLVAIGSGGAFTAAQFLSTWHRRLSGQISHAMTPAEAMALGTTPRGSAVALFSAGGENPDIRGAFFAALGAEPPTLMVITAAPKSRLADAAREAVFPALLACDIPAGRDGFLATNSLLAFCLLVHRAYVQAARLGSEAVPPSYATFMSSGGAGREEAEVKSSALWDAESVVVLHGYATKPAAVDFESKCTEAALTSVQVADYRNFAHGRHHWLAKRPRTAVLALSTPEDSNLAAKTLALLPKRIPVVRLHTFLPGMLGGLRLLTNVMLLVGEGGVRRGMDPGRPGVPQFGSRLYSLRFASTGRKPRGSALELTSISRKVGRSRLSLEGTGDDLAWRQACKRARDAIESTTFRGVVFDYDGTLVDPPQRYSGPVDGITAALQRLLAAGVPVGIATGRGQSVGRDLRARLDQSLFDSVIIGYYNGGDVATLRDDSRPDGRDAVQEPLRSLFSALSVPGVLGRLAKITPRLPQLTVEVIDVAQWEEVWDIVQGIIFRSGSDGVRAVLSGHSIDILAPGVSKLALVDAVRRKANTQFGSPILRIGDRGRWPGNDAEMLSGLDGLSVNEVSRDPGAAWNFAPPGWGGVRATLAYCAAMEADDGRIRIPNLDPVFDSPDLTRP